MVTNASAGTDLEPGEIGRVAQKAVPSVSAIVRHVVMSLA